MSYLDILDALCPSSMLPGVKQYIEMYNRALTMLNGIKLSRYKAMFFGSMQVGPDLYEWDGKKIEDFTSKYFSCVIYVMNDLYKQKKDNMKELVEISLSILYSMLALFINANEKYSNKVDKSLIEENDKYVKDNELEEEFED